MQRTEVRLAMAEIIAARGPLNAPARLLLSRLGSQDPEKS